MPSILCYKRSGPDAWREYFCPVNQDAGMADDPEAASAVAHKHLEAAFARGGDDSVENFAMSLKDAGYVRMSDFRRAGGQHHDLSPP